MSTKDTPENREPGPLLGPGSSDVLGHTARHPTLAECEEAGRGPYNCPGLPYQVGGLPDTDDERARFEAYMRGHCWEVGNYDEAARCYVSTFVRCLYGVWRDRGALPTVGPNVGAKLPHAEQPAPERAEGSRVGST